ncbi:MAG: class I SAM-dependent methyltransferase [Verrucomicrobiae bacterium]|nr:class I SAM-dependent methyltransferase [Verrucomicrobiae bacterium]
MPESAPAEPLKCHACGSLHIEEAAAYAAFHRVTSDCKPWPQGGRLIRCRDCGLVQTAVTDAWRDDADRIYRDYTIYHQSGGSEQRVFGGTGGVGQPRSERLIRAFRQAVTLPQTGRLLDIGCGNGSFLTAWSRAVPGWALTGTEVNDKYRSLIEAIPGVERLHTGPLPELAGAYDVISLIHVLEHIPDPVSFLDGLRSLLRPGGLLLVEVPDCGQNPSMLLVADHCSHFAPPLLAGVVAAAGFESVVATHQWVAKEVSVVGRRPVAPGSTPALRLPEDSSREVFQGWTSLEAILARVQPLVSRPSFGLFGTAIAATWLDAQTGGAARFFVDEDPTRHGRTHLGRPILAPSDVPPGSTVFVALPAVLAGEVTTRLRNVGRNLDIVTP